jgi:hypothetical protein
MEIPKLSLSLGQIAWALNFGQDPPQLMRDQLNYLRQLGVPEKVTTKKAGSGNRITYDYDDLIECGVALFAVNHGMKYTDVKNALVPHRSTMRQIYRDAISQHPEACLDDKDWIKMHGKGIAIHGHDIYLRLHDRYAESRGKIDTVGQEEMEATKDIIYFMGLVERFPDGCSRYWIPISMLALQWTYWARIAPPIKAGRKS